MSERELIIYDYEFEDFADRYNHVNDFVVNRLVQAGFVLDRTILRQVLSSENAVKYVQRRATPKKKRILDVIKIYKT